MNERRRLRNVWGLMRHRCDFPNDKDYKNYGGRGIFICDEWHNFDCFYDWAINNGYRNDLSIDRVDNDGPYCADNCRWTTSKDQANNKRGNVLITCGGKTKTLTQWSEEVGISVQCLWSRLFVYNWPEDKALTEKTGKRRYLTHNGITKRLFEWANDAGINYDVLESRINCHGWTVARALTTPATKRSA